MFGSLPLRYPFCSSMALLQFPTSTVEMSCQPDLQFSDSPEVFPAHPVEN